MTLILIIVAVVLVGGGVLAYLYGNKEKRMNQASEKSSRTEKKDGEKKDKWHQRMLAKMRIGDGTTKGSFLEWAIPCLMIFFTFWLWDEFGAKLQAKGTEPIWQTMYPWEGELTQDVEDAKALNPPGEGYPISIEIKDPFVDKLNFDKLDLYIVGRINEKDLPPQRYNPPRGFKPDLNVYQSYKVVLGSKSGYKRLHEGLIEIKMDTTRQWIGPQASNASVVALD